MIGLNELAREILKIMYSEANKRVSMFYGKIGGNVEFCFRRGAATCVLSFPLAMLEHEAILSEETLAREIWNSAKRELEEKESDNR